MLHALAQGGFIRHERDENGRISHIDCFTRNGHVLADCTIAIFTKLRSKRLIESRKGSPYRISQKGRITVRPQVDNR